MYMYQGTSNGLFSRKAPAPPHETMPKPKEEEKKRPPENVPFAAKRLRFDNIDE